MNHTCDGLQRLHANESVLLIDGALIEEEDGIVREVQPGIKIPFLMEPDKDKPWEYCGPGMSSDRLRWQVKWNSVDFSKIKGAVKLRVFLNSARIYSFSFGTE